MYWKNEKVKPSCINYIIRKDEKRIFDCYLRLKFLAFWWYFPCVLYVHLFPLKTPEGSL